MRPYRFRLGDKVIHKHGGIGTVEKVEEMGNDKQFIVSRNQHGGSVWAFNTEFGFYADSMLATLKLLDEGRIGIQWENGSRADTTKQA